MKGHLRLKSWRKVWCRWPPSDIAGDLGSVHLGAVRQVPVLECRWGAVEPGQGRLRPPRTAAAIYAAHEADSLTLPEQPRPPRQHALTGQRPEPRCR